MEFEINTYDGFQPSSEIGYIKDVIPKVSGNGRPYGQVLVSVPKRRNNQKIFTTVPFYLGPNVWKKYKAYLKAGDLWVFYFKLTGNEANGIHYCNASVTNILKISVNANNQSQAANNDKSNSDWSGGAADSLDHYENNFD